ncbi:restriction endonuclease subunit S [Parathalassolituus penaei]|uniref:Restriction endonuclease subunit S n=1 Tax=Parathalassolituus penaei TaxID=2997323 RepID=A0A9X3ISB3_9GAMM|nr:restriction endonuclease subunit S [Parathalassolituus penaei]MCY0965691.1 restriction endonuclease subunit S [Parathalassolituus penaei]
MRLNTISLGAIANITMGQSPDSQDVNHDEKGVPFLQGCAEFGRQTPVAEAYCAPPLRTSQPDSILISVRAPVGTLNWAEQKYCIGRGLAAIKAIPALADTAFLFYVLQSDPSFLHRRSQGSTFLAISSHDLHSFPVPDFPRSTQQKIARILQTVDQAIEKTEQLIEKYQQIKAGLMNDLFTRGIGADGQLRPPREHAPELYQHTPIGWIPKEWELSSVLELFEIDSGITLGAHRRPSKSPMPYLRVANVYAEELRLDDLALLEASKDDFLRYRLKRLDLLIVEGHANVQQIGRCAIVNQDAEDLLFQNHLFRLRSSVMAPMFAMYFFNSLYARKYWERSCSTSSGLNTINRTMLGSMPILLPSTEEQSMVVAAIETSVNRIEREKELLQKLLKQKSGLMHDLLTGTVPVSIDSASEVTA